MGGKSGTTTQSVSIPPEVLARYRSVNAQAERVAQTPFQQYTGQFVAGLTPTQQAGIQATSQYSQAAQPYYQAATGQLGQAQGQGQQAIQAAFGQLGQGIETGQDYAQAATGGIGAALQYAQPYQMAATGAALAGGQQLTPENINIQGYMSPYTQAVADTTYQALRQQQQQEMQGATANAIKSGAFGGDRAGLVAANLARQQQLGTAQAMAPIYQQGYQSALGTAMTAAQSNRAALQNLAQQLQGLGQQGYGQQMGAAQQMAALGQQQFGQGLGAAQQLGALGQQQYGMGAGTAQQLAALGSGAQQAALQGAQAQLGAGTLEQQTQQADLTARYQQFLQERGYPFQVAQFLANIAMGTGALSGSTTTTTQPMPFFSDRRVKDDVKEIGETHDGLPIYSYKYKGDDATRIGLMAQDVEKKHPEAVYDMGGVKGVDYKQATEDSERPERYAGGLVPASMGGAVTEPGAYARGGYAPGGLVDPNDLQALIAAQQEALGPFGESGLYGGSQHQAPFAGAKGIVPQSRVHVPKLMTAGAAPRMPDSGVQQVLGAFDTAMGMKERYDKAKDLFKGKETDQEKNDRTRQGQTGTDRKDLAGPDIVPDRKPEEEKGLLTRISEYLFAHGGVVPRDGFAVGGSKDPSLPYEEDDKSPSKYFPTEILETEKPELAKAGPAPTPTSQTGVSLGTLLGLFLKDGGVVPRRGYQQAGVVEGEEPEPYELGAAKEILRQREGFIGEPKYDVNALRAGYGTDQFTTPEGKVVPVTAETRFTREDAERDLSRRVPIFMQKAQSDIGAENWQRLTPDARAALTSVTYNYGRVPSNVVEAAKTGDMRAVGDAVAAISSHNEGINAGRRAFEAKFINPEGDYRADLPSARATTASLGVKPGPQSDSTGKGLFPSVNKFLEENQAWLSPMGAGLKGMFQSRSPFLGAAIGEGLGAGLEAVTPTQKALADINLTRAQAIQTGSAVPEGSVFVGFDKDGSPMYRYKGELFVKRQKSPTQPTDTLADEQKKVIQKTQEAITGQELPPPTEYGPARVFSNPNNPQEYSVDITPTEKSDRIFEGAIKPLLEVAGLEMSDLNPAIVNSMIASNENLKKIADADMIMANERKAAADANPQKLADLRMMSTNINKLSQDAFTGSGADAEGRQALGYLANTMGKIVIGPEFQNQDWTQDIESGAIINKLREMMGTREAGASGIRAGYIAEALSSVSPGSSTPQEAANELLASMYIAALAERDFGKFFLKYGSKGTALGVNQAFRAETDDMYRSMKPLVKMALTPTMYDDGSGAKPTSPAQLLMEGKVTPREFDEKYGIPGFSRVFLGG